MNIKSGNSDWTKICNIIFKGANDSNSEDDFAVYHYSCEEEYEYEYASDDGDSDITPANKVSGFNGLTHCYVCNMVQYNTVLILFLTENRSTNR